MSAVTISKFAKSALGLKQFIRNTKSPVAELQNTIAERMGYAASVRNRQIFSSGGALWSGSATALPISVIGTRRRWLFQFHSDPYTQYITVLFFLARQDNGAAADCYGRLKVYSDAAMTTCIGQATHRYGSTSSTPTNMPAEFGASFARLTNPDNENNELVDLIPNTDYWCEFEDVNYARIVSACVWEVSLPPDTDNGFPAANHSGGSPIYDSHRAACAEMGGLLHRRGGAMLWNWHTDTDAGVRTHTTTPSTHRNLVDDSSTTVSSQTPGVKFQLTSHATIRQSLGAGCPVKMWAYVSSAESDTGSIRLVDEGGDTMLEMPCIGDGVGWVSAVGYLPATLAKYDLHYGGNTTGSLLVYAVSIYEYEHDALDVEVEADSTSSDVRFRGHDATSSLA